MEHVNKNGEIVPFLLVNGSAPFEIEIEKKVNNENVKCFSIEENENEIVKTEVGERKEPNVDAVGSGAVYAIGAVIGDESDSDDDIYEDANYYDSDSENINMAHDLNKIIMICQTISIKDKKVNVCFDYGAAFSMLSEKKAEVALLKGKGQQVHSVIPGVPDEERAKGGVTMPLATVPLPLAGRVWGS
jgi:hypothetical protein